MRLSKKGHLIESKPLASLEAQVERLGTVLAPNGDATEIEGVEGRDTQGEGQI